MDMELGDILGMSGSGSLIQRLDRKLCGGEIIWIGGRKG